MILFIYSDGAVVHSVPLDSYMPGGIQETKESLAREMNCRTEDIKVKITGIRNGKPKNGSSLRIQLIDEKSIREFFE